MINVTLPDEKSNYVHRIGRVGRAERMGLAISLVASVPEKVIAKDFTISFQYGMYIFLTGLVSRRVVSNTRKEMPKYKPN